MEEYLDEFIFDLADKLDAKAKRAEAEDRTLFYNASRLLRAFNELFAIRWSDVSLAEARIKDPEVKS